MNLEAIYPQRPFVLINDSGFYFDEINKDLKDVLEYPDYDFLLKNIEELKNSKKVIILYPTQKREIELMSVYLPIAKTPVNMLHLAGKFLQNANKYDENEMLKLAEKENRYGWLSIFVFGRLHKKINLNPSYLLTTKPLMKMWEHYDLKGIALPNTKEYINSNEEFSPILFLELAAAELLGKETRESIAVKKLLSHNIGEEIKSDELDLTESLFNSLMSAGLIYQKEKGKIVRI